MSLKNETLRNWLVNAFQTYSVKEGNVAQGIE